MKTKFLVVAASLFASMSVPAFADDTTLGARHLDQVQWFHAPLHVQLTDEDPILTDRRPRPSVTNYTLVIPPLPASQVNNKVIVVGQPEGLINSSPLSTGWLPPAGPRSNISPDRLTRMGLPNGLTVGTHSKPNSILPIPAHAVGKRVDSILQPSPAGPQSVASYPRTNPQGSSGTSGMQTSSSAIGELLSPKR
jgi:hypothetical protein